MEQQHLMREFGKKFAKPLDRPANRAYTIGSPAMGEAAMKRKPKKISKHIQRDPMRILRHLKMASRSKVGDPR